MPTRRPDTSWPNLRDMIKYKIDKVSQLPVIINAFYSLPMSCQNTSLLLQETEESQAVPLRNTSPIPLASGGLRLPPFSARKRDETNPNEAPKSFMTEQEASELKGFIFAQLHEFDELVHLYDQRVQMLIELQESPIHNTTCVRTLSPPQRTL